MSGPARATHASSRAVVLDLVRAAGTISRVGLVNASGLTGGTISTVVRGLIDDGLVVETGHAESTGGKRRVLLQLNHFARYAIGVHLDDARITYVLTNLGGSVVARISRASTAEPSDVVARMAREVDALINSVGVDRDRILGLGLVSPGPAYEFDEALRRATGLPVVLDNDATAAAIGEYWAGGVGATSTFAALYMGTGIGAGLLLDGITYRGPSGNAGEIGHTCLDVDGPRCWCGGKGCLEALAGPATVVTQARADRALARAAGLTGGRTRPHTPVAADFAAISRAARRGDTRATALLEKSARYMAAAARTLVNLLDLELLVLTGPSFAIAGSVYLPVLKAELDHACYAHPIDIRLSPSAASAPAVGAAAIVLQSELVPLHHGLRLPDDLAASEAVR